MSRPSNDRILEWASVQDWEASRFATSEDEVEPIRRGLEREKRQFLLTTALGEIAERTGTTERLNVQTRLIDFASLPTVPYITRQGFLKRASGFEYAGGNWNIDVRDCYRIWDKLQANEATISGHYLGGSKYDDASYWNEQNFQRALNWSENLYNRNYSIRFLMHGAKRVYEAALSLETVDDWTSRQDPDLVCAHTQAPSGFWDYLLDSVTEKDCAATNFDSISHELAEGLFMAPYVPGELTEQGEYTSFDELWLAGRRLGMHASKASPAISKIITMPAVIKNAGISLRDPACDFVALTFASERLNSSRKHYDVPGIPFLSRMAIESVLTHMDADPKTDWSNSIDIIQELLDPSMK